MGKCQFISAEAESAAKADLTATLEQYRYNLETAEIVYADLKAAELAKPKAPLMRGIAKRYEERELEPARMQVASLERLYRDVFGGA